MANGFDGANNEYGDGHQTKGYKIEAHRKAMHGMMASTEAQPHKTLKVDVQIFKITPGIEQENKCRANRVIIGRESNKHLLQGVAQSRPLK